MPHDLRLAVRRLIRAPGFSALAILMPALGLAGTFAAGRLIAAFLFDAHPAEPAGLGAAITGIGVVAFAAGWIPVARAARLDPLRALRAE